MMQHDLLNADMALARMVLSEVGVLERQLVRWMAEMHQIDRHIFWNIHCAWKEQRLATLNRYYGSTVPRSFIKSLNNDEEPLKTCMATDLPNIGPLPKPPEWLENFSSLENRRAPEMVAARRILAQRTKPAPAALFVPEPGLRSYLASFKSTGTSLPDEQWFDQALQDQETLSRDFPALYWLGRESLLRRNPKTSPDLMDARLEFFQIPDTPQPSRKTLSLFTKRLAEPDGNRELDFARNLLQGYYQLSLSQPYRSTPLGLPPLYRAAILPQFVALIRQVHSATGSIRKTAEAFLQTPGFYSFRHGRLPDAGIMAFGAWDSVRTKNSDIRKPNMKKVIFDNIRPACLCMITAARDPADVDWLLPQGIDAIKKEDVSFFNRLVSAIGAIGTPQALRGLTHLRAKTRHATMLSHLNKILAQASAALGLTTVEAEEFIALDHGLDTQHRRRENLVNGVSVVLSIAGSGQGVIHYEDATGSTLSKLPAAIRKETGCDAILRRTRADAKQLSADMTLHRQRLERSWLTGQTWSWPIFEERWLLHPVLGWLARKQIWLIAMPGKPLQTCMIRQDGTLLAPNGNTIPPLSPDALLSLWHPLHAAESETIAQWRTTLAHLQILQPIRQAWRETYTITRSERETSPASYRYARRILNQAQVIQIGRQRGWRIRTLTGHMPSSESAPWTFQVPAHGVYVEFRTGGVGDSKNSDWSGVFTHVMTDRIRFCILKDEGNWSYDGSKKLRETGTPVRLADIDRIVFSEVMRDVDLMVSTTTSNITFDPETLFSIPDLALWRRQSGLEDITLPKEPHFGNIALGRRQFLEALLPELGMENAVTLEKHHALVNGKCYRYRIHLGSGDIMVLPQQRQLVVEDRKMASLRKSLPSYRPLHDDAQMDSILQKIVMLIRDDRIRDQSILDQLNALGDEAE